MIRIEADEVTYNLHILLRYELERDLTNGKIRVDQLPTLWNARCKELFGAEPKDDAEGVLQDIHWYGVSYGYFPSYAIGNLMAAQVYATMMNAGVFDSWHTRNGGFDAIRRWLQAQIWQHGKRYPADELIKLATGSELTIEPFKWYLTERIGPLYGLKRT